MPEGGSCTVRLTGPQAAWATRRNSASLSLFSVTTWERPITTVLSFGEGLDDQSHRNMAESHVGPCLANWQLSGAVWLVESHLRHLCAWPKSQTTGTHSAISCF